MISLLKHISLKDIIRVPLADLLPTSFRSHYLENSEAILCTYSATRLILLVTPEYDQISPQTTHQICSLIAKAQISTVKFFFPIHCLEAEKGGEMRLLKDHLNKTRGCYQDVSPANSAKIRQQQELYFEARMEEWRVVG
jgi:hypothetical protein